MDVLIAESGLFLGKVAAGREHEGSHGKRLSPAGSKSSTWKQRGMRQVRVCVSRKRGPLQVVSFWFLLKPSKKGVRLLV